MQRPSVWTLIKIQWIISKYRASLRWELFKTYFIRDSKVRFLKQINLRLALLIADMDTGSTHGTIKPLYNLGYGTNAQVEYHDSTEVLKGPFKIRWVRTIKSD